MTNEYNSLSEWFTATANAIRSKTGSTELISAYDFPEAIEAISVDAGGSACKEWFNDGDTHVWISLSEGRTSPVLGIGVNGTVTVDWGDGTEPNVLTGTSTDTTRWTPIHNYTAPGDYVITLSCDGEIGITATTSYGTYLLVAKSTDGDYRSYAYRNAITKVECGNNVTSLQSGAFQGCTSLKQVVLPKGITTLPSNVFRNCRSLESINIPDGVTAIESYAMYNCTALTNIIIPNSVTTLGHYAFQYCYALTSVTIFGDISKWGSSVFDNCSSLVSVVVFGNVTVIGEYAFLQCRAVAYYDFTSHTAVPTLKSANAFSNIPSDCEIRVPAALVDEWKETTNWSTYAGCIVGV